MAERSLAAELPERSFYASHSRVSDPGELAWVPAGLSGDLPALRRVARGLVIHYRADDPVGAGVPAERLAEIDTRYAEAMLARLLELRDAGLGDPRDPAERLVGCCRDYTVLFVMLARARGIPARSRVGFATYFFAGLNIDHEVAEVWDEQTGRWRLVDAQLADDPVDPTDGAHFDPLDLPRERFRVAGAAWKACRGGDRDPETFMVDPGLEIPSTRGWPYLRHNLVHDLAALNKVEMLLWDEWGLAAQPSISDAEERLLDRVADLTASEDPDIAELRRLYHEQPRLRVPDTVTSYNPLTGEPRAVTVG